VHWCEDFKTVQALARELPDSIAEKKVGCVYAVDEDCDDEATYQDGTPAYTASASRRVLSSVPTGLWQWASTKVTRRIDSCF
jgi:hypothetical protein